MLAGPTRLDNGPTVSAKVGCGLSWDAVTPAIISGR